MSESAETRSLAGYRLEHRRDALFPLADSFYLVLTNVDKVALAGVVGQSTTHGAMTNILNCR